MPRQGQCSACHPDRAYLIRDSSQMARWSRQTRQRAHRSCLQEPARLSGRSAPVRERSDRRLQSALALHAFQGSCKGTQFDPTTPTYREYLARTASEFAHRINAWRDLAMDDRPDAEEIQGTLVRRLLAMELLPEPAT